MMDTRRYVFGAFMNESLKPNGRNYFGNDECCVVSIFPQFNVYKWQPSNNEQFVLATDSFIGFGGGGAFALWLDSSFEKGTSESCFTFGNTTSLASSEVFTCAAVEIWTIVSPALHKTLGRKALKTMTSVMGRLASKASTGKPY